MKITKMHGTGNDFIVIEDLENNFVGKEKDLAVTLCDRHFGVGGDGILLVRKSHTADIQMVIINSDGSYASMCGNGLRCFVKYVFDNKLINSDKINVETGDGIKLAEVTHINGVATEITINMGEPSFEPASIPALVDEEIVNMDFQANNKNYKLNTMLLGVPHTIIMGELNKFDVEEGKYIENSKQLFPQGTNVNFCEVIDRKRIKVKTWERGAGATLACGTGCCASVVACNKLGLTDTNVSVQVPGGELKINICEEGVMMTGPAVTTFTGETELV
ncbi:MAG: diaminopimelate epimerase [Bacillota bacterium]|nr:diaminopimelate epimerase [Bacillota bacterium]